MSSSNRKKWFAIFFIIVTLAIPFVMIYYVSTDTYKERYQKWRKASDEAGRTIQSKIAAGQMILTRDQRLEYRRTALVYKGTERKNILIDLYLLDFDPQQAYQLKVLKRDAKQGVDLGGNYYELISVNKKYLSLKIVNTTQTP